MIDSGFTIDNNDYSQMLLEECKYLFKEIKMSKYIIDNIEISSDSDEENSNKENSEKENSNKESWKIPI